MGPAEPHDACSHTVTAAAFLSDDDHAVAEVTGWIRAVAEHRAWGFDSGEDLVQEALLAVLRNLRAGRYREGNLKHYVRRIAKNICVSSYRRARLRRAQTSLEQSETAKAVVPDRARGPSVDERVIDRMAAAAILASLEDRCRRLIQLAFYERLPRREIADRLGISETAAKVRLFRCMERARQLARS